MSLERAYINCKRCYGITQIIFEDAKTSYSDDEIRREETKKIILTDGSLYTTRNEALRALEETCNAASVSADRLGISAEGTQMPTAIEALKACTICDYSEPNIANIVEKEF